MQHLDDGIIHALLDGELSAEEAEALSEHVRYCAACADRLAEERLIQSEAERMIAELDGPAPAAAGPAAPPQEFEPAPLEPQPALAPEQPKSSGPPVVLIPDREFQRSRVPRVLGWAATLVVAAGAGYFASVARQPARAPMTLPEIGVPDAAAGGFLADSSGGFLDTLAMTKSAGPADSAAGAAAESQAAATRDSAPLVIEESESEREPQAVVAAQPPAPVPARANDETVIRGRRREADQRAADQRATQRDAAPPAAPAPTRPAAESNRLPVDRVAAADAPAETGAAAPAAGRASTSTPSALEQQAQIRMRIGLDETQRMLGSSLHVIDGLQQQFVGLVDGRLVQGANPNAPVVRVVYLDDQRRPIYLDQQRLDNTRRQMGLARDTTPPDWVIGDVWLSLKGSLPASELAALAQRVR